MPLKVDTLLFYLAILMAVLLPLSLSLSYVPLTLALGLGLYVALKGGRRYPRDTLLLFLLYLWRAITLILNHLPLKALKDLYDKMPYPAFSLLNLNNRRLEAILMTLGGSASFVSLLGLTAAFSGAFRTGWVYTSCRGNCDLTVKRPTEVLPVVLTERERNFFVGGPEVRPGSPVRLKEGRYVFHSRAGAILKVRAGDVSLGKGWVGRYEERRFFNFTSFVGFYDHKMHSGAVFGILTLLYLTLGLFYRWYYLLLLPLLGAALLLSGAKSYILAVLLLAFGLLYSRMGRLRAYPHLLLALLLLVPPILLYSPLRDGFLWSLNARLNFWRIGLETFPSSPVFGVGYDNISSVLRPYYVRGLVDNYAHLHSSYLNALVETGVVGLLLVLTVLLYFLWKFFRMALKSSGLRRAYLLGVALSILLVGVVGTVETNYDTAILNLLLTFLMGVGSALGSGRG